MQESISASAPTEEGLVPQARAVSSLHVLRLAWKLNAPGDPAVAFAVSIARHLFDSCSTVLVETKDRGVLDDLDLDELVMSVRSGTVEAVTFRTSRVELAGEWRLELTPAANGVGARCRLGMPVWDDAQPWHQLVWLQASFAHASPLPALAVPRGPGGISVSVFHGLVVLATRFGQVDLAELERVESSQRIVTVARWHFNDPPKGAIPVIAHENETLWLATTTPPPAAAKSACWVEVIDFVSTSTIQATTAPDATWQERLSDLLATSPPDGTELAAHLQALVPLLVPFRVGPLSAVPPLVSMAPPQDGIVCVLVPTETELPLSYSPTHRFTVPPNLHVLGTMNTADRSIALMDVALRRRFTFEELMPSSTIIREVLRKNVSDTPFIDLVVELFDTLNARIRFLYDRDHQLGHAYFLEVNDVEDLRRVFVERIIPLLQEYFYGAWDKICTVLGCPYEEGGVPRRSGPVVTQQEGRMVYTTPIIQASPFQEGHTLGFDHAEYEERLDFTVVRGFQEGRLSRQGLIRTFVSVLQLPPEAYASRLAALMSSAGDPDEASDVSEAKTMAEHVETEVAP